MMLKIYKHALICALLPLMSAPAWSVGYDFSVFMVGDYIWIKDETALPVAGGAEFNDHSALALSGGIEYKFQKKGFLIC
ncbi:hypothetical protein ACGRL8_05250 [Vibrio rumoiensis]|uniref:hypothetical protein n=1 Tax=Vibrio rumoiensis TaxID=76258 RepID=UPI000B5CF5C0|nr:hypothetical protein [Vibrio rumoiensis]